jgi:phytoene desaturase
MAKKAIVIGAGVGGLATALRLRKKNFDVTVFEQQKSIGGKIKRISQDGFSWGFGASLLTMPHLIDELFVHCGKNPKDYYEYVQLDPICKYFFEDGKQLYAHADIEKFAREFEMVTGEPASHILSHLNAVFRNYQLTEKLFLQSSIHRLKTYIQPEAFKALMNVHRLEIFTTMNRSLEKRFKTPHAIQLFNRYATYNGSDPYKCPATMHVIAAPEYTQGGFMLKNGMPQLCESMYSLAKEMGVKFHLENTVERIETRQHRVTGVWSRQTFYPADVVVSNMDIQYTYTQLLPHEKHPENILSQPRSTSAVIFYWGMKKHFPQLETHNILFSNNYPEEFRHKGELKTIYQDPTIYIFISSKINPQHAPAGGENWFTLINAPYNIGQNWNELLKKIRPIMIEKISRLINEDIEPHIASEHINTPATIENSTLSYLGSLYGNSSDNIFSAFLRHPNFTNRIKNLFFCGGSVHPGGGVPLCLLSAKLVDELVD